MSTQFAVSPEMLDAFLAQLQKMKLQTETGAPPASDVACRVEYVAGRPGTGVDHDTLASLFQRFGFRQVLAYAHFQEHAQTLCPPTGYVAQFQSPSVQFNRVPLLHASLCFGIALFRFRPPWPETASTLSIPSSKVDEYRHVLLSLVRDRSPRPASARTSQPNDGWVESLGDGGSIHLCFAQDGGQFAWYMVVRSGLDRATLDEAQTVLQEIEQRKGTALEACRFMERLELLADANRKRLAWTVMKALDLQPLVVSNGKPHPAPEISCLPYEAAEESDESTPADVPASADDVAQCLTWLGLARVPGWYVMPARAPAGPRAESFPAHMAEFKLGALLRGEAAGSQSSTLRSVQADMLNHACIIEPVFPATTWNVLRVDSSGNVLWYSECTPRLAAVAMDHGPGELPHLVRVEDQDMPVVSSDAGGIQLHAIPNVGVPGPAAGARAEGAEGIWLDMELARNINLVRGPWSFHTKTSNGGRSHLLLAENKTLYFIPTQFPPRVSAFDQLGRVYPADQEDRRPALLTCWSAQDDRYVPVA